MSDAVRAVYRVGTQGGGKAVHLITMHLDETVQLRPVSQCARQPAEVWVELKVYRRYDPPPGRAALYGLVTCERCRQFIREEAAEETRLRRGNSRALRYDQDRPAGCLCQFDMLGRFGRLNCPVHYPEGGKA